ncbi:carbonyl reductase family member 4-like [Centruroides sculpturatus]|uniref:carbonyl reductase family member 4-like n=1 Tax=Centruroides sculpturatus TaxID=218467 RepID=UPI000C6CC89A|nr:carbonyl reductase family member 4-like [Centruroides sculpturatus]
MASLAVVFGGTKGIGRAIAEKFLKENFSVVVLSRNNDNVKEAINYLRSKSVNNNKFTVQRGLILSLSEQESYPNTSLHQYISTYLISKWTRIFLYAMLQKMIGYHKSKQKLYCQQHYFLLLLNSNQQKVEGLQCDVKLEESIKNCHDHIEKHIGSTKFLVNAAGVNINRLLLQTDEEELQQIIDTNLISSIKVCKTFIKSMMRRKSGSIINIGSIVGQKGNIGQTIYSSSKSGLVGFTKSLAREVASRNVTVNLIIPGFIETEMTSSLDIDKIKSFIPLKRTGMPEEVAEAIYFLSTASFITGETLVVDGGLQLT